VRLSQVRLLVDDPALSYRFYRDVLGLAPSFGEEGEPYASFEAGEGTVAIFARVHQAEVVDLDASGDGALVVLEVDDLQETSEALLAAGLSEGAITDRPDWGLRVLHVRDPDGHLLEIVQPIPMEET
jgi:catechol 2,3-dioxygenase-like lactoylglutathione lyase family enzyme